MKFDTFLAQNFNHFETFTSAKSVLRIAFLSFESCWRTDLLFMRPVSTYIQFLMRHAEWEKDSQKYFILPWRGKFRENCYRLRHNPRQLSVEVYFQGLKLLILVLFLEKFEVS